MYLLTFGSVFRYTTDMKINDPMSLPVGTHYFEVSEEVWFMTGEDDADRDFVNFEHYDTLAEAIIAVMASVTSNRLYIDLMERTAGGAHGLPVFAGYHTQMIRNTADQFDGWRFSNFGEMGEPIPSLVAA